MKRLLIANRGEIARRVIRTAHGMGIATVAVYSEADHNALHVREASTAFALGGSSSADSYLRVEQLLKAAQATGVDAVHPGYGFLSENADFAQAVMDAGLIWVGPPAAAIRALGSKSAAKALAQLHGVPCLPGYSGNDQRDERFIQEAERTGYPIMVKAVAGGGGRGMRLVHSADELVLALHSARSEALAGFGDDTLLIERALLNPRHVEVQIFADAHGHCIHLGERDCSVQRRHQKIIEEAPSPAVSPALRAELGRCAVKLAQAAAYVGAGTVEFLLEDDLKRHEGLGMAQTSFFLMEMNTRLQVEHPVTEMLTGLDLVEWQIRVARGEPLALKQEQVSLNGHAIEVRLCAEDANHTPHSGCVQHFQPPELNACLRFDHAIETGGIVTPHYDSLLGKLIVHAPTRELAIERLAQGLDETQLLGLPSNRAFLAACLRHPIFRKGSARIPFLYEHGDAIRTSLAANGQAQSQAALVALLAVQHAGALPGAALALPYARPLRMAVDGGEPMVVSVQELAGAVQVRHDGRQHTAQLQTQSHGQLSITLDHIRWTVRSVRVHGRRWHVQLLDAMGTCAPDLWVENLSHQPLQRAGLGSATRELRAPFNGKVVAVHAAAGQTVQRGTPLLVIESMKLEHTLSAPRDTTVETLNLALGQQVIPGQLLVGFAA